MAVTGLVSVIILTWNRKADTGETIGKVKKSDYGAIEIIVVDNASADGSRDELPALYPDIRYCYLPENIGIGGYNRGIQEATGEFFVFLDSDSYPEAQAIRKMIMAFRARPRMGALAFDVRNAYLDTPGRSHGEDRGFNPLGGKKTGSYNGAGVGIRRECVEKAGDLFAPLFLYLNEFDHSFRIWDAGYEIRRFSDIVAFHKASPSGRTSERMPYFYTRNILWIIWRYFPVREMTGVLFVFYYHAIIASLSQRTTLYGKAIRDAMKNFPRIMQKRSVVSRKTLSRVKLPLKWVFMSYR